MGLVLWVALCVMISCRGTIELCVTELVSWLCSHGRVCVIGVLSWWGCVMGGFVCYDIMPRHHGIVRYRAGELAV